uniref:helix-turn-helix domain-containing protein n=1 Tax=Vibrio sp. S11_S32 TaxID=2720225 RepID=UPI0031454482
MTRIFRVGALYSLSLIHNCHLDSVQATTIESLLRFSSSANAELNKQDRTQNDAHPLTNTTQSLIDLARLDPDKITKQLDVLFLVWLQSTKEDQHSQLTRKTLSFLQDTSISQLGLKLNCSQRTVERSFNRVTGLTLKQCQAMMRLEAMLEYLYQRDIADIDWADIAARFGFSDQPHLIRTLKKQIGLTPQHYAKQRGLTIDVYGGVQPS